MMIRESLGNIVRPRGKADGTLIGEEEERKSKERIRRRDNLRRGGDGGRGGGATMAKRVKQILPQKHTGRLISN